MKKIYSKIILDAGVTEEELEQFKYTESDIEKLTSIINCENKLSNSSIIAHHRKEKSYTTENEYKFSEICDDEALILSQFESDRAKFHATLCILRIREELYDSSSMLIASAAVEAGATACTVSSDLVMLNMASALMIKNLSVQSAILSNTQEEHPPQSMYAVLLLNNLALINCKIGNMPLGLELYKQAWFLGNKFFISIENIPFMDNIKMVLDEHVKGFTSNKDSAYSYIAERGVDDEDNITLVIKSAIQKPILSKCTILVANGKWDNTFFSYGLNSYITPENIVKVLKKSLTKLTNEIIEEAQMQCFQQICVITQNAKKTLCLEKFVETYPKTAFKILNNHPEYCIDAWIFHHVGKKLSEGDFGLNNIPSFIKTIDILLNPEEDAGPDQNVETIGEKLLESEI
jgi:hypothetical protein